jgi:hypothetical protein
MSAVNAASSSGVFRCRLCVAPRHLGANGRARRTPACGKGLVFSLKSFLQDQLVERQLGDSPLQAVVLALEIFEALGLVELQAAVLASPEIVALLRDADASTNRADRLTLA